ncbi:MAG: PrsW family intramembrane metalloprotease [Methanomicrobiales archaeon]
MGIHSFCSSVGTIARWEVRRTLATTSRSLIPVTIVMVVLLLLVTGFAAEQGFHLTDGIYLAGTDDPQIASLVAGDPRFEVITGDRGELRQYASHLDLVILDGAVEAAPTERGDAALRTLSRDYEQLQSMIYRQEEDLFAAYPLWIDLRYVTVPVSLGTTEPAVTPEAGEAPTPAGPAETVDTPPATPAVTREELREDLARSGTGATQPLQRYTSLLTGEPATGEFQIPDQIAPPLPFDSLILVFVFIFPLYFVSQFFMMSVMDERLGRKGEILLATPLSPAAIVAGKALPYTGVMLAIALILILMTGVPPVAIAALLPVVLFFLAAALLIGMVSRSFRELSFLSILFSTMATAYLFLPSVFANIHVISLISPLTLIVLLIQGEAITLGQYLFSTVPVFLAGGILWAIGTANFTEERLFAYGPFMQRVTDFIGGVISIRHPYASLALLGAFSIPFVFMIQLLTLALFFNLPLRLSLPLLIIIAAFIEESAKSAGIIALYRIKPAFFTLPAILLSAAAVGVGFLAGEKLLLFATLAQITQTVFAQVLFLSIQSLWMPFLLHATGVAIVAAVLRLGGPRASGAGILAATAVHSVYNLVLIAGVAG